MPGFTLIFIKQIPNHRNNSGVTDYKTPAFLWELTGLFQRNSRLTTGIEHKPIRILV